MYRTIRVNLNVTYQQTDTMKNPCKSTRFYSYSHKCILTSKLTFGKGWQPHEGLCGVDGKPFSSYLLPDGIDGKLCNV